jgi:radical SAM superfamily enzyme YgiQ (UPF0313 family)
MITLLAEIGVRGIAFGIETFNHAAGRAVGKGTAPEIVKQFLMDLRKSHPEFYLGSGFIVGLPHESIESVYETNDWLVQAKVLDTWHFSPLAIYNGPSSPSLSEFSKTIEQYDYTREGLYGWRRKDLDFAEAGRHSQILNRANDDRVGPSPWTLLSLQRQHTDLEELRKIRNGSIAKSLDVEKFELYRNAILLPARGSSALMQSER